MVLNGTGYFRSDNQGFAVSKGDLVLLTRGSKYSMCQSRTTQPALIDASKADRSKGPPWLKLGAGKEPRATVICSTIAVDQVRWHTAAKLLPSVIHVKSTDGTLPYWAGPLNDLTAFNLMGLGSGAETLLCRIAEICVIQSLRAYAGHGLDEAKPRELLSIEPRINAALRLITGDPGQNWTVSRLAAMVGMSRSAFNEAFTANIDETPMRYLTRIRMERAGELMRIQGLSLSEIATRVGYESESAFARTFKRSFGVKPRTYRKSRQIEVLEQSA